MLKRQLIVSMDLRYVVLPLAFLLIDTEEDLRARVDEELRVRDDVGDHEELRAHEVIGGGLLVQSKEVERRDIEVLNEEVERHHRERSVVDRQAHVVTQAHVMTQALNDPS